MRLTDEQADEVAKWEGMTHEEALREATSMSDLYSITDMMRAWERANRPEYGAYGDA